MAFNRTNNPGNLSITDGPEEIGFNRERGYFADLQFTATRAEAKTKLEALVAAGYSPVKMTHVGGDLWRVTAEEAVVNSDGAPVTSDPDTYIKTKWSVPGNMLEKDLWEKPSVKAALDAARSFLASTTGSSLKAVQGVANIRKEADALVAGELKVTLIDFNYDTVEIDPLTAGNLYQLCEDSGMSSGQANTILAMVESKVRGVTHFPVSQWVLKRVKTGPLSSSLRAVRTNVNRMFTTAGLSYYEGAPSNLLDGIPDGYWLKQTPSAEEDSDRLVVTNEFWWAEDYDRFALGDPIAPP